MTKRVFRVREGEPLFDIFAKGGRPQDIGRLTPTQLDQISRTVRRVPEVMVKVLPQKGSTTIPGVIEHLHYIAREGDLELDADSGKKLDGKDLGKRIIEDWDLDVDDKRRRASLQPGKRLRYTKLVHKLIFSMPAGTPPNKVLAAVRNLAREEWGLQHRYVMALHTDEPHPHVHVVVKAISEQGVRLDIRKATLRHLRSEFARNLRALGVEANATERAVRGQPEKAKKDGIYRATLRGDSIYTQRQAEAVARELLTGKLLPEPGKEILVKTRTEVAKRWNAMADRLSKQSEDRLSQQVRQFLASMPPPQTDKERIAAQLMQRAAQPRRPPQVSR